MENSPQEGLFRGSLRGWRIVARSKTNGEHSTDAVHSLLSTLNDASRSLEEDAMTATRSQIENLVMRIQTEYLEQPALALTLPSARTRFGLDEVTCAGVLGVLVDAHVLTQHEGAYSRYFPRLARRRAA
jgi:hypothetical protein